MHKTPKKRRIVFPDWTLDALFYRADIPKYLEVDLLTLSVFMIYAPFFLNEHNPDYERLDRSGLHRLYN
jgi:hypothetical protein